jgi:hypothetical protein
MNKQIEQLAITAGWDAHQAEFDTRIDLFAELIVQACADLALSHSIYSRGVPWNQVILQHWHMPIADSDVAPYLRTPQIP